MKIKTNFKFVIKLFSILLIVSTFLSCNESKDEIDSLIQKMTIEEKVGQMTQINISEFIKYPDGVAFDDLDTFIIDEGKLRHFVEDYHVGSFLNGLAVSSKAWYEYINELQKLNMKYSKSEIPMIYGIDHIHGATYLSEGTIFPQAISLGCSFNPELAYKMGLATIEETAHLGHHWVFNPVLGLARNKYWPRMHETYGEDEYLASVMGTEYIKGIKDTSIASPYKVAACAKHYLGYSVPHAGWDRTPAEISDQTLYEFLLPPFKAAIDAGVKTVMINSGEINGIPVHASYEILTKLLREELKFKGVAVTDWEDIISLYKGHKIAKNEKEATYIAIKAGVDMSMVPYSTSFCDNLVELVKEERISEERINLSVRRILQLKKDLGLFEHPFPEDLNKSGLIHNVEAAKQSARESVVLMKNENNILPLSKDKKILLSGPCKDLKRSLTGGWTFRWQPVKEEYFPEEMLTIQDAMKKEFGENLLISDNKSLSQKAVNADIIVLSLGETTALSEGFNSINNLDLEQNQLSLIDAAVSTGKPVVLVLTEGRPRTFPEQVDKTTAILYAGLPGFYGAEAIADILSGDVNPSGKMNISYPYKQGHMLNYNHKSSAFSFLHTLSPELNRWTISEFGSGLSYSDLSYSEIKLNDTVFSKNDSIKISVTVNNKSKREAKEAVLLFVNDEIASVTRPVKELKRFKKKLIRDGESEEFNFVLYPEKDLSFNNKNNESIFEPGYFNIYIAGKSARFKIN